MPNRIITESTLRELLKLRTETKNLDFKGRLSFDKDQQDARLDLIKDVLAMANTQDGGTIIIGVRDGTYDVEGLTEVQYDSFDQTKVNDFLHRYADPKHSCQVYKLLFNDERLVVITVPEFAPDPIICKADAHSTDQKRLILRKGAVYMRTAKATSEVISDAQEMRAFIGRAMSKRRAELLASIQALFQGGTAIPEKERNSPYESELANAASFFDNVVDTQGGNLAYWQVSAHPVEYVAARIASQMDVRERVSRAAVSIRGWDFPHTDPEQTSNFAKGFQSQTNWMHYNEAFRAFFSGFFAWRGILREDGIRAQQKEAKRTPQLSFVGLIYSISEYFAFFERYYSTLAPDEMIRYRIALVGTMNRALVSDHFWVDLYGQCRSIEPEIVIEREISVAELQAGYRRVANEIVRGILAIFNCNDVNETTIATWQERFFNRQF